MTRQTVTLTFGTTYCLIEVNEHVPAGWPERGFRALPFVIDGQASRPLDGRDGAPVEFIAGSSNDAMDRACQYLQGRFGPVAPAPTHRTYSPYNA